MKVLDDDTNFGNGSDGCPILSYFAYSSNTVVPILGGISSLLFSYLFYLYFYMRAPLLHRHPTSIAIWKCLLEFILAQQYIWVPFLKTTDLYTSQSGCRSNKFAAFISFISEFSALGSELILFVVTYALYKQYKNPFTSYKYYKPFFISFVLTFSIIGAIFVTSSGPEIYGISNEGIIWIQDRTWFGNDGTVKGGKIDGFYKFFTLYLIIFLVYVYSIYAIWTLKDIKERGLDATLKNRRDIILRSQKYVLGYMLYWTILMSFQLASFVLKDPNLNDDYFSQRPINCGISKYKSSSHCIIGTIIVYTYASRGIWGFAVIVYINWNDLKDNNWQAFRELSSKNSRLNKRVLKEIEEYKRAEPHLNEALRAELVLVTTQGIMFAARHQEQIYNNQLAAVDETVDHTSSFQSMIRDSISLPSERKVSISINEIQTPLQGTINESLLNPKASNLFDDYQQLRLSQSVAVENLLREDTQKEYENIIRENKKNKKYYTARDTEIFQVSSPQPGQNTEVSFEMFDYTDQKVQRIHSMTEDQMPSPLKGMFTGFLRGTLQHDFSFKDYCPRLFAKIRRLQGIDNIDYANSFITQCKLSFSEGRSGAFLFFSGNEKFVCKTTSKHECKKLKEILPQFIEYLEANPKTLICPFYGCHCITMYGVEIYFTVMQNAFPVESIRSIDERYDLKGSWVNRTGTKKMTRKSMSTKAANKTELAPLYQDTELLHTIILPQNKAITLKDQLLRDTAFLASLNLMDYSLLVGVHRERFPLKDSAKDDDGGLKVCAVEGPGKYYFRLIDVLQEWNWKKKIERFIKIYFKRYDPDGISAMEPRQYQMRFMRNVVYDVFDGVEDDSDFHRRVLSNNVQDDNDVEESDDGSKAESDLTVDNITSRSRKSSQVNHDRSSNTQRESSNF